MALADDFDADLQEVTADMPVTFLWRGRSFACVSEPHGVTRGSHDAGIVTVDTDARLIVRAELFAGGPGIEVNDIIVISGDRYRVTGVEVDETGTGITVAYRGEDG